MTCEKKIPYYKKNGKLLFFERTESEKWALENPEECSRIISSCKEKLCKEIAQYRDEIPGAAKVDMEEFRNLDIDYFDADLSIRTNNIMRRNNIKNVGMILDYDDIKDFVLKHSDQHIPLFQEVRDLVAGRVPLLIEIKPDGNPRKTAKVKKRRRFFTFMALKSKSFWT